MSRTTSILFDPGALSEDVLFDPTPLLKTFEDQIDQLWKLHDDIEHEVAQREDVCRKKEDEHKKNMEGLDGLMQVNGQEFRC